MQLCLLWRMLLTAATCKYFWELGRRHARREASAIPTERDLVR